MDQADSFSHGYTMKRPIKQWECNSIYAAYENYCWSFSYNDPTNGKIVSGNTFDKSALALSSLSRGLRRSIQNSDSEACQKHYLVNIAN